MKRIFAVCSATICSVFVFAAFASVYGNITAQIPLPTPPDGSGNIVAQIPLPTPPDGSGNIVAQIPLPTPPDGSGNLA